MLSKCGTLTAVYDNSFTSLPDSNKLYVVNGPVKQVAINNCISKQVKKPFVFYAGNSIGDYQAIQALVTKHGKNILAVAIYPIGSLTKLVKKIPAKNSCNKNALIINGRKMVIRQGYVLI